MVMQGSSPIADRSGRYRGITQRRQGRKDWLCVSWAALRDVFVQNVNRSDPCITRGVRVEITCPNRVLVWLPAGSNLAAVSKVAYCVWLNALYASHRNWKLRFSLRSGNCLDSARSKLFTPGFRMLSLPAFPESPFPGRENATVLNQWKKEDEPEFASPTMFTRCPSPPPVRSTVSVVVKLIAFGVPLTNWAMPLNC